jgi:glutathione-regulated potassium-efflux system protein KefB
MADASHASFLPPVLTFLAASVIAVPLAARLRIGSVMGYLAAGLALGPSGLRIVTEPDTVRVVAEIGVVLLLFVIGLELKLSKLMRMRRDIFGLGTAQLLLTAFGLALVGANLFNLNWSGALLAGLALALSSTAIALQILDERGALQSDYGQRSFAVLLLQDLSIVPLLAVVPLLATMPGGAAMTWQGLALSAGKAVLAVGAMILVGLYLLNPMFRLLARSGAREIMTAAALLVVLGAALAMEAVGLSMALGAFLAGLLLAESHFRHELEADIEPFRGLLMGLFFMSVGMGLDLSVIMANAWLLACLVIGLILLKTGVIFLLMRATGAPGGDALRAGILLAPASEFAFVVLPIVAANGLLQAQQATLFSAAAALTMFLGPLLAKVVEVAYARHQERRASLVSDLPVESFDGASGSTLVIGFGRFGQMVNQVLLTGGVDVTVIDKDIERIRGAARFGFKVYYGDGARLDVLHAAGAGRARVVAICIDDRDAAVKIVELIQENFPLAEIHVRAYDRIHAMALMDRGVDHIMRETVHSATRQGGAILAALGVAETRAEEIVAEVMTRDEERLKRQQAENNVLAGADLLKPRATPEPLAAPAGKARPLSSETREIIDSPVEAR